MNSTDIEIAVSKYFGIRQNIIVPNVSWGFHGIHELDLAVLTSSGYLSEVEIKISKSNLKADKHKRHGHKSKWIKKFWFAVPEKLKNDALYEIPERAGLLVVSDNGKVTEVRKPVTNAPFRKLELKDQLAIARLGCMRIWGMKDRRKWMDSCMDCMRDENKALKEELNR